tara:strand:+ start:4733 stop:5005 length:273 start_codon:yes stop_codon:yes gene_type:complete
MFNKEEKPKTSPELPASPKVKNFSDEIFLVESSPKSSNDASFIINTINENPGKPAIFENCTGSTFNQVYKAVGRVKPTWDEAKGIIKYKQ